jgi:sensor histidine kinase YesM
MNPVLNRIRWSNSFVQFVIISFICALAVPVIDVALHHWPDWSQSLAGYLLGIIYAICVGGILSPLSPWVWKRSCRFPVPARWLARGLFLVSGTAAGCLLAGIPVSLFLGHRYHYWASFLASFQIALVLSGLATVFMVIYANFKSKLETSELQLREKEVEREKALKLATEATLSSLESRMHPHFLFNTINSISSLIQEDPARAEKMLSQMADLLRFSLDSARTGLVPLSHELKIVHDYLEIEKARFENRLRYQIEIPAEFDDVPFPPLSLQTLVENSVKYAVSATRTGADIAIRGHRDGSQVIISVEDNGPGFDASDLPAGHGLSSLTARLESLYQGAAKMKIGSQGGRTVVALQIPALAGARS